MHAIDFKIIGCSPDVHHDGLLDSSKRELYSLDMDRNELKLNGKGSHG